MPAMEEVRINWTSDIAQLVTPLKFATGYIDRQAYLIAQSFDKIEKNLKKAGRDLSTSLTLPLVGLAYASVRAADYNKDFADSVERMRLQAGKALVPLGKELIATFEQTRPSIEAGIRYVNGLAESFRQLDPKSKASVIRIAAFTAALGPAALAGAGLASVLKVTFNSLGRVLTATTSLTGALIAQTPAWAAHVAGETAASAAAVNYARRLTLLRSALVALTSFEFGRQLYDDFKPLQIFAAGTIASVQIGIAGIDLAFGKLSSNVRETWGDLMQWISSESSKAFQTFAQIGGPIEWIGRQMGSETTQGLGMALTQLGKVSEEMGKINQTAKTIDTSAFVTLDRQIKQISASFKETPPIEFTLGRFDLEKLLSEKAVDPSKVYELTEKISKSLQAAGEPLAKQMAEQFTRVRDDAFAKLTDIPEPLRRRIIEDQFKTAKTEISETLKSTIADIEKDFGDSWRKGDNIWKRTGERIAGDLFSFGDSLLSGGALTKLLDQAKELAANLPIPEVLTKREAERIEKARKEMEKFQAAADSVKDRLDPTRAKVGELADAFVAFSEGLISERDLERISEIIKKEAKELADAADTTLRGKIANTVESFSQSTSDAFADMVISGKAAFDELARSWAKTLLSMVANEQIFSPLAKALGDGIRGIGAETNGGGVGNDPLTPTPIRYEATSLNALGNAFNRGKIIPFAAGGVVTGPKFFPMANGMGLMGEAGPEAIMPLQRINGELGVRSAGGGTVVNVIDQRRGGSPVDVIETTGPNGQKQIQVLIRDAVKGAIRDGSLDKDLGSVYGLGRRGARR